MTRPTSGMATADIDIAELTKLLADAKEPCHSEEPDAACPSCMAFKEMHGQGPALAERVVADAALLLLVREALEAAQTFVLSVGETELRIDGWVILEESVLIAALAKLRKEATK